MTRRDLRLLNEVDREYEPRAELIAPLDALIWDRKLIAAVFGFEYRWEIYTPAVKRRYGYYTMPLLYGDRFVGRADIVREKNDNVLRVKNLWFEPGIAPDERMSRPLRDCLDRFAEFNGVGRVVFDNTSVHISGRES